ncbi:MAG: methyl-accepting chemotaxis protein [Pseudomonas sp.]
MLFTLLAVFFIALNAILGVYAIHTSAHVNSMYILLLATSIIGSLSLAGLGYLIIRRVKFPLQAVRDFTLQLAAGNLEAQLNEGRLIEVKQLTSSLSTLRKGLISIASDVRGDMELFLISAREIAQGNQDLASRTDEQAHSLQQTASSMEEITSTVEQNASNAKQASQLAGAATCSVQTNGKVMRDVVGKMNAITESAHKMREIINVIDAIAFQTNILALNASVEAARAGEQGKGFAVVATEVRNLASRSATAAQEIRHLIDNSSQQIEMGADLVRGAEMGIEDVIQAVTKVNDIIGEISVASSEQSSGITLVNQAVAQMDAVTQQNAILVQDAARIAKRLEDQVSEVERAIAVFRLERVARKQT